MIAIAPRLIDIGYTYQLLGPQDGLEILVEPRPLVSRAEGLFQ